MAQISGAQIRSVLLEVVEEFSALGPGYFQSNVILRETVKRLALPRDAAAQHALLTFWGDLFRHGHLSWGHDIDNPDPPFCHLTTQGQETLRQFSRDPANPAGYLEYVKSISSLNAVAMAYIEEALATYNASCFKATAVMVGTAAESVVLEIRDAIVGRLGTLTRPVPNGLNDWRVKRVLAAIESELAKYAARMPPELRTEFEAYWPAFTQQIRAIRNDAGHPTSIAPVTPESVHGALLIFPEVARLGGRLVDWVTNEMP